jgi:excisionase family DNA binding protein
VNGPAETRYPWGGRPLGREDILTAGQVAELFGMKPNTIEDYARRGLLPSFKLGRHRRFIRAQVEARIAELLDRAA